MRESSNLFSVAESLRNSALEDLRSAQAIGNELALLGQMALDQLKEGPNPEGAHLAERLMPDPAAPRLETWREANAPLQVEPGPSPGVSDTSDTDPGAGGTGPRRQRATLEGPDSAGTESPAPPAGGIGGGVPAATVEAGTPSPPLAVEADDASLMSAAEQFRREFAAGAHPRHSPEAGAPVSPTRGSGHRTERSEIHLDPPKTTPGAAAEALRTELAAQPTPPAGVQQPGGPIPMPASPEPKASVGPLPKTYKGRLYVMFRSSLGQEEIGSVWEILEDMVPGSIVENRLISSEAGIQFTLNLGSKVFEVEQLQKRMPGAKLAALEADRLKVDWPPTR